MAVSKSDSDAADWPAYGRNPAAQHFSPLAQIDAANVSRLGLSWSRDLPAGNVVSEPVEFGGTLYFVTGYSVVHAVDAASGRTLWDYDPKAPEAAGRKLRLAWGARGLAWWQGKIYVGTQDGRLIAIDAHTGKPVWSVMTVSPDDGNFVAGPPRVFAGRIIIGFGGADVWPGRGYVTTYDAQTGKQLWRWYTVPGNPADGFENKAMAMAAKTWSGAWWKDGGGGAVWNAISYDPDTDTVFIGTANGLPWNDKARGHGDNLFVSSMIALDGRTGRYKWHYQFNPGDSWDFDATDDIELADLSIDGRPRKVAMMASKNGFFYVIDRIDGKLISAEPFAKETWASKIDLKTGRPVENPEARYPNGSRVVIWPSDRGAHNWYPMAFSPRADAAFIPVIEKAASWVDYGLEHDAWRKAMPVLTPQAAAFMDFYPDTKDPLDGTSRLVAWDVRSQKAIWSQPTPGPMGGSVMATAGNLVFQGRLDGQFNAYNAETGALVWSFQANAPVIAPPISYAVGGHQYVAVLAGPGSSAAFLGPPLAQFHFDYWNQPRRVLTFALDGKAALPPPAASTLHPFDDPDYKADDAKAQHGATVFALNCLFCHGIDVVASGFAPDLRASSVSLSAELFAHVVKDGALVAAGMPRFGELSDVDMADLRQYVRARAQVWRAQQETTTPTK